MKKLLQKIFSIKNQNNHKIFSIFGVRFKIKNKYQILLNEIKKAQINSYPISNKQKMIYKGIIDNAPNSFKNYILENNMPEKISKLKKDLDNKSLKVLDTTLKKIIQLPDWTYAEYLYYDDEEFRAKFETEEDKNFTLLYNQNYNKLKEMYKLSQDDYDMEVFMYHHGLLNTSNKIKEYIKNKDFIDAGAFIGDSALVFMEYNPKKIFSFEISKKNIKNYIDTMQINNISKEKYEIIPVALSDKEENVLISDNLGMSVRVFNNSGYKLKAMPLDIFLKNKDVNIGFIKADVEGSMYKMLCGMTETIRKYRPVLSLSIYHSPEEFFETKPLLDEITKDLNYKIEMDCHYSSCFHIYGTIIWAYPQELI